MRRLAVPLLCLASHGSAFAASSFTPDSQPYGYIAPVTLSAHTLTGGSEYLYLPWFDNNSFDGSVSAYSLSATGAVNGSAAWTWNKSGGAVIHSNLEYVGGPDKGYPFASYMAFANKYANETGTKRSGTLYVGANDGKLYSLAISNGAERDSFTPTTISSTKYGVDGPLTTGDVYADFGSGNVWKSILIGGLGAGGKGYFAVDITDETNIQSLWEFSTTSSANLGYTYAKPLITRLNYDVDGNGTCGDANEYKWGALLANGYLNNGDYKARLYVVDIVNGNILKEFPLTGSSSAPNGLSSPAAVDSDGDYAAELVYAGDLDGNLWKFDLSSCLTNEWAVAEDSGSNIEPLFTATDSHTDNNPQAITSAPDIAIHPQGGYLVYVGTGEEFQTGAQINSATHESLYAIWDKNQTGPISTIARTTLVTQDFQAISGQSDARTATSNSVDWSTAYGWKVDLASGEEVLQDMQIHDGRLQLVITDTLSDPSKNWLAQLDYEKGQAPDQVVFDADNDGDIDASDDLGNKRVAALNKSGDLVSRQLIARASAGGSSTIDIAFVNAWTEGSKTLPVVDQNQCTRIFFEVKSDSAHKGSQQTFAVEVIGYLNDSVTISRRVDIDTGSNESSDADNSYTFTPATPDSSSGAGEGQLSDGTEISWNGLSFSWANKVRPDEFEMFITFDSPYKLTKYDLKFYGYYVEELDDGLVQSCTSTAEGGDGAVDDDFLVDKGVLGRDVTSGASWTGSGSNRTMALNNHMGLVFNGSNNALTGGLPTASTSDASSSAGNQKQNDYNNLVHRILWRELQF